MTKKKLADFKTQRANANKHTERGLSLLDKSIRQDGWIGAVTVAADGETFDGSARLETIATAMSESEPIIVDVDGTRPVILRRTDIETADDPRAKRLAVAANAIASADWNPDGDLLAVLAAEDDYIAQLVKNDDRAAKAVLEASRGGGADAEPQVDRAAELQVKWQTATGQLWQIGAHRLLCGDSTKREDVERVMGGEKAQVVVSDPPYAIYGSSTGISTDITDDNIVAPFFEAILKLAENNLHWFGHCYYCCDWRSWSSIWNVAKRTRMISKNLIVWDKGSSGMGNNYSNCYELTGFFHKLPKQNAMGERESGIRAVLRPNLIRLNRVSVTDKEHNAQKPVELMEEFIKNSSESDGVVLEPFAGSGTTLVACQNLSRRCRAIEISPAYCAVILERMTTAFPGIEIKLLE